MTSFADQILVNPKQELKDVVQNTREQVFNKTENDQLVHNGDTSIGRFFFQVNCRLRSPCTDQKKTNLVTQNSV